MGKFIPPCRSGTVSCLIRHAGRDRVHEGAELPQPRGCTQEDKLGAGQRAQVKIGKVGRHLGGYVVAIQTGDRLSPADIHVREMFCNVRAQWNSWGAWRR